MGQVLDAALPVGDRGLFMLVPPIIVYTNLAYLRIHFFGGRSFSKLSAERTVLESEEIRR